MVAEVRAELLSFPVRHDDVADDLGLCGQILDRMVVPRAPAPKEPSKILSTDPSICNISLTELFEANERRHRKSGAHPVTSKQECGQLRSISRGADAYSAKGRPP